MRRRLCIVRICLRRKPVDGFEKVRRVFSQVGNDRCEEGGYRPAVARQLLEFHQVGQTLVLLVLGQLRFLHRWGRDLVQSGPR